jgi:thiol-disulfide isomerase/thioredoxin
MKFDRFAARIIVSAIFAAVAVGASAQKPVGPKKTPSTAVKMPVVKQIDAAALGALVKSSGKPLLVNFWATWCDPCREEFPDLVKLDNEFHGKLDFIVISLDDLAEINRDVPKFLAEMKADMPAYLLKTDDEGAAIAIVSKDWKGGLPFTVLYDANGQIAYFRQGKVNIETVRSKLNAYFASPTGQSSDPVTR